MKPKLGQSLTASMLFKPLVPVTCSAIFLLPSFTFADTKGKEPKATGQFEEVIVTARRKDEELQEVPISVNAFSADYLRENNITEMSSLAAHVPSMSIEVAGSSTNAPIIALRGQRPAESLITIDPAVPLYFADVALTPTQGTNISLYDLSNVQVLKGPQGMLFGRSSTGGAVLFTPTKPGKNWGGYVQLTVGDYNLRGFEGAVDVPVADQLQMRFSGFKLDRDGYQENIANNALHGKKYWDDHPEALRWSMNFEPTDSFSNLLVLDWSTNSIRSRVPTPLAFHGALGKCSYCYTANEAVNTTRTVDGVVYPWANQFTDAIQRQRNRSWQKVETDYDAKEKVTNQIVANTSTYDFNEDIAFKNILAFRRLDYRYDMDTDGTALAVFGSRTNGRAVGDLFAVTYSGQYDPSTVDSEQYSDEMQLAIKAFDNRLDMVVGAYYFESDASEDKAVQLLSTVDQWRNSPRGDAENVSKALFSEGTFDFTDEFALTLGVRYTEDSRTMIAKSYGYTATGERQCLVELPGGNGVYPMDQCARKVSEDFSAVTWRAIGTYKPQNGMMYYASLSTGYRPGGFNLRATEDFQFDSFKQEEVLNYELGSKIDWLFDNGVAARFNVALFWQDYTDIQKTQGDARSSTSFGTSTVNAAGAVVRGADVELSLIPIDGLTFSLNYSYIDAYYTDWKAANPVTGVKQDQSDFDFLHIPRYSGNSSISYLLPLDPSLGDITFHVTYSFTSKITRYEDVEGTFDYPGQDNAALNAARVDDAYHVIDLRVDWANFFETGFDAALWVKNLEDKAYNTGGLQIPESLGLFAATYGPPRTVGASLRYKF